jgi:hypothetical protein
MRDYQTTTWTLTNPAPTTEPDDQVRADFHSGPFGLWADIERVYGGVDRFLFETDGELEGCERFLTRKGWKPTLATTPAKAPAATY